MSLHGKLIKLIELSRSDNDFEAVSAVRKAHQIVDKNGLRWSDLIIDDAPEIPKEFVPRPKSAPDPDYLEMIDKIRICVMPGFDFTFLDSCENWFRSKGFLTGGQRRALNNIYQRVVLKR